MSRSEQERNLLRDRAYTAQAKGSSYSGMSYEEGIMAVLDWLEDDAIVTEELV